MALLRGRTVDLKLVEKDDYWQFHEWWQDWEFRGPYVPAVRQRTKHEAEKEFVEPRNPGLEYTRYFIQKMDGTKVGAINHFWGSQIYNWMEISYATAVPERGKGYTTEAVQVMVDYLFLSRQVDRIQAVVDVDNQASQKVLEKAGFRREGELRKSLWNLGRWRNSYMYSMTRDDWKEPRILKG